MTDGAEETMTQEAKTVTLPSLDETLERLSQVEAR